MFAIVYKEILQLTMIDEFLEMVKYDFYEKVWPKLEIKGDVVYQLPPQYDQRFLNIMQAWEKSKHEAQQAAKSGEKPIQKMKTFDQSNKSKKSLKKEAKKKAILEAGGQGNSNDEDDSPTPDKV